MQATHLNGRRPSVATHRLRARTRVLAPHPAATQPESPVAILLECPKKPTTDPHPGSPRTAPTSNARGARRAGTIDAPPAPPTVRSSSLARLEQEDGHLAEVEVDEVFGFVGDVRAEVAANDAVPGGVVLFVELLLDEGGNVLLDVVLLESLGGAVDSVLLHVLGHVRILNHGLAIRHGDTKTKL